MHARTDVRVGKRGIEQYVAGRATRGDHEELRSRRARRICARLEFLRECRGRAHRAEHEGRQR